MRGSTSPAESRLPIDGAWRRLALVAILRLMALVGTGWLTAVFIAVPELIRTPYGISEMVVLAGVYAASIAPFSDRIRFIILEVSCFCASAAGMLVYGLPPGVAVFLGLAILLAAVYYGWKGGLAVGAASLALLAAGAWGWTSGRLPVAPAIARLEPTGSDLWIRALFAQILAICGITGIVTFFSREMGLVIGRLRIAEEKFSKAFRTCPDALIISELETGRLIEVNEGHRRLTGFAREEVIGRTSVEIGTFTSIEDREDFSNPLRATGSMRQVERQIMSKAGAPIDVLISAECFEFDGMTCALSVVQDITERKRAESALAAKEERFRSFIENAGVGIYRSTPAGQIVMANPALLRIMGFDSFHEMASRNLEKEGYEPSYSRKDFKDRLEATGSLTAWETAWARRDGTTIFVRESASVIRGPDGAVQYYDGIIEDISERMTAEQALRESEERFRKLTAAAFEGIVISENGRIVDINDQGLAMFGYERSEMLGRSVVDFVSPEARPTVAENIRRNIESVYEHELLRKDGGRFRAQAQSKMTHMGGRNLRMTALQDVTERRQNEQRQRNMEEQLLQAQKMEALGTLAGGIAHDFNNILTGILGNLQLAELDLPTSHPAYGALESAAKASRRARELVARILSFSLPRADNRTAARLGVVVLEAVELLRVGLASGIEIHSAIDPECPQVEFEAGQIHQVIMNLGTNSAHAMRERGGLISIGLRPVSPGKSLMERYPQVRADHAVCLSLRDNGCGMEPSVLKRIFEPFYTTKEFGKGTGLGLAMVHTIVKSHDGAIVVESAPGAGTTFELYFPAAASRSPEPKLLSGTPVRKMLVPFGKGRTILVVDDEESVLNIGARILRRLGFLPMAFGYPREAIKAFAADPAAFSAVITDFSMPEMNGIELARQIQTMRPGIPTILTTGYLQTEAMENAKDSGVTFVVTKPFDVNDLADKVRLALDEPVEVAR